MIKIIELVPKLLLTDFWTYLHYNLKPDDILFMSYSDVGALGEEYTCYLMTYKGEIYRLDYHNNNEGRSFLEYVCPFLKYWEWFTLPSLQHFISSERCLRFCEIDWCQCYLGCGNFLFVNGSIVQEFAEAIKGLDGYDIHNGWKEIAIVLVKKMIEEINPNNKKFMFENTDINRFIEAQEVPYFCGYKQAMEEVKNGRKTNHWIWYIFPQLRCLGRSSRAHYYGIANQDEAQRYLEHPILGARIREITEALLEHKDKTALSIFGDIDAVKVRSCMTMFDFLSPNDIFGEVLDSFYKSERCKLTLRVMQHG